MGSESTFPEWWNWELSFTGHAELRMEQRGVTEVDVRAMLERAIRYEPSVHEGADRKPESADAAQGLRGILSAPRV